MRWIGILVALIGVAALGVVGLINVKYDTSSACSAAAEAVRAEAPGILAELSRQDDAFAGADRATRPFPRLREALEGGFSATAAERAAIKLEERSALECAFLVVYREVSPEGFRRSMAKRILEKRDAILTGEEPLPRPRFPRPPVE